MAESRKKATKKTAAPKEKAAPKKKRIKPVAVPEETAEAKLEAKVEAPPPAPRPEKKIKPPKVTVPRYYGTGRRKEAIAKVWLTSGSGKILLNDKPASDYLCRRKLLEFQINRPFDVTKTSGSYDVFANVYGGGVPGQAMAVSLGISRALVELNPDFKVLLKREGLLTRDPRMKERKKYGLKRARRAFQYTKR